MEFIFIFSNEGLVNFGTFNLVCKNSDNHALGIQFLAVIFRL